MRRLFPIAIAAVLVLALLLGAPAAAKKRKKLKINFGAASEIASMTFVQRRSADATITAGQVLPCERRSRLKVECVTLFSRSASPPSTAVQNCSYTATIFGTKKGKAFLQVTPDACA
jgi:hypothetical protein